MQVDATIFNEAQDTKNQEAWVLCFFFARKTRILMKNRLGILPGCHLLGYLSGR